MKFLSHGGLALQQKFLKIMQKLYFFCALLFVPISALSETPANVKKVNGEEVYEPKPDQQKMPTSASEKKTDDKKQNMPKDDKNSPSGEKKTETMPTIDKKMSEGHSASAQSSATQEGKYKSNKIVTLEEEDPYEIRKPMGIFWFAGVFLFLLIVIFVFT